MRKKILFLTTRLPYPANDGRSVTLLQYLEMISKYCNVGIVSFNNDKNINNQPDYLDFVEELKYPSFIKKILNICNLSFLKGYPLQISGLYSKKSQKKFNKIVKDYKPDIIICDMLRTSLYVRKCHFDCEKILDMDDMLSNRYYLSLNSNDDPLGQFKDTLPGFFVKILKNFHLNKLMLKVEAKKMKKNELKAIKYFSKIIFVSQLEVDKYNLLTNNNKAFVWPVCVKEDIDNYKYELNKDTLCFLGNMDAVQNQSTLNYICKNIYPKFSRRYKILVVGKCSEENKKLYKDYEFVKFTGFVDSFIPFLKSSLCMIAPIQYGSGIKIKILDGMKLGVPIITTKIGVEGLNIENGKNIFVVASDDEYGKIADFLFENIEERNKIGKNAIEYINNNHTYSIGEKILLEKILEVDYDN